MIAVGGGSVDAVEKAERFSKELVELRQGPRHRREGTQERCDSHHLTGHYRCDCGQGRMGADATTRRRGESTAKLPRDG